MTRLITDTAGLAAFCRELEDASFVTVDTEFMRERTFWPKLCLLQLGGPEAAACVDPLANGIDLTPAYELMANEAITKVFHAARQDLEIFYNLTGRIPAPLYDTQVAAMVCGFGDQVGYETLVAKLARVKLDKGSRFTDWSVRPLSTRQVEYALGDVTHLRTVYERLSKRVESQGRSDWVAEEMATLREPSTYVVQPADAWRRLKVRSHDRRFLAVLREVAGWREQMAQNRDLPRNRVLRDEALLEIAHARPTTQEALGRTRGLSRQIAESAQGTDILAAVTRGLEVPDAECPKLADKTELPARIGPVAELLRVVLKMKCEEHDVAQRLVASSSDLDHLAAFGDQAQVAPLAGWRRRVFGEVALRVRAGELALIVEHGRLRLVELED